MSYQVLFRSLVYQKMYFVGQLLIPVSLSIQLDLFCVNNSYLGTQYVKKNLVGLVSIWRTFISIVIVNWAGSFFWVLIIYIVSYQILLRFPVCQNVLFFGLLIYMDNFYFHCHCQFSWIYSLGHTNLYCVLPSPT